MTVLLTSARWPFSAQIAASSMLDSKCALPKYTVEMSSAREQSIHKVAAHAAREFHIRELRFQGERALFEPQIQSAHRAQARPGPLRRVHMDIHEAGQAKTPLPSLYEHAAIAIRLKKVRLARVVARHNAYNDAIAVNFDKRVFQILEFTHTREHGKTSRSTRFSLPST